MIFLNVIWSNGYIRFSLENFISTMDLVSFAAVIRVITQRSSPLTTISGEERCMTTLITAATDTMDQTMLYSRSLCGLIISRAVLTGGIPLAGSTMSERS